MKTAIRDFGITSLLLAPSHAQSGRFPDMLAACQQIMHSHAQDPNVLLDVGTLLLNFGFLTKARLCFETARRRAPKDLRPLVNLANVAREAGDQAEARRLYAQLLGQLPDHPVVRRNALVSLEYDPAVSDAERRAQAVVWGDWAISKAGGVQPRPTLRPLEGRPLRVGYVSADFCQHTVGMFVKGTLNAHDQNRVTAFAYSAGSVRDWVTAEIQAATQFRDVAGLDDAALAALIRQDEIDVLIDLSGHTGGSRLTVFAHRPSPVQVSWLGYFATTGLSTIDAVLLDDWHAPPGMETQWNWPGIAIVWWPCGRECGSGCEPRR